MRPAPAVVRTASRAPWFGALLGLCVALGLGAPARAQVPQTPQTTTTPSTPAEGAEAEQAKPAVPVALPALPASAPPAAATPAAPASAPTGTSCPPAVDAAVPPRGTDRGLMWRISRDGRSSYLFGTLHVGKPAWRRFGPLTSAALRASDLLALELDPTDPAVLAALADSSGGPPVAKPLIERLHQAFDRACLPVLALATLHPVLQATTLTVLDARWLGMDPNYSVEVLLVERSRGERRRVVSLESVGEQKQALVPADAAEAATMIEQTLEQLENGTTRRVLRRLAEAWESGDLAALEDYESWCECASNDDERAFLRRLNDERNAPLADRIAKWHAQGKRVFAAVGALHMTGPQALPRLLAARGFKVERVAFNASSSR